MLKLWDEQDLYCTAIIRMPPSPWWKRDK